MQNFDTVTFENALEYLGNTVGAMLIADQNADRYRALVRRGIFQDLLSENGTYKDLVQKLWFHFQYSDKQISEEYRVFIPNLAKFAGKYSRKINLRIGGAPHVVQMTVQPFGNPGVYLIVLDELDASACQDSSETQQKMSTIQNTYLFTMCFDLVADTTGSLSLAEVSDETMHSQISYSDWRLKIVNMIRKKEQRIFLERSDPAYLRRIEPGQIDSFDCQMQNLEGEYIWVKLIFSRMDTTDPEDYRFVYMVQNIHESTVNLRAALKHYEKLSSRDPLTHIYNHGRIETEICNAIEQNQKQGTAVSMLILDIDHFKEVNDRFGHAVGDTTLIRFTEVIRDVLSKQKAAFGRWGGEEFAVVLYDLNRAELEQVAEEIRARVALEHFSVVGSVTCSIGASELKYEDAFDTLFERVDQAVYRAKSSGRNCVCVS